ncbi:MAG TPA: hypothetical protein PKL15_17940, partial [Saprospiraceae bacterium]|nr:hypothetical protein [Saprospiraceae bacterium]
GAVTGALKDFGVSDDVVKDDLEILSEGQLELHEGHSSLDILAVSASKKDKELARMQQQNRKKNGGGSKNRNRKNYGNFRKQRKK